MLALYCVEAASLRLFGSDGSFAALVAADPIKGYLAILTATCLGGYVIGTVHQRLHGLFSGLKGRKKQN